MYLSTKLSDSAHTFTNLIMNNGISRSNAISTVIAKAFTDQMAMPSSPVKDFAEFFRMNYVPALKEKLGFLNEIVIIDIDTIIGYAEDFMKARYNILYPPGKIFCNNKDTVVADFFGLSKYLSNGALDLIQSQEPIELTQLYNGAFALGKDLEPDAPDEEQTEE